MPPTETQTRRPLGMLLGVMLTQQTFGALTFPVARAGLAHIEPYTFAFYRFVLAAIVLLAIVRLRRYVNPVEKRDYLRIVGLGALIILLNQTAYLVGQSMTAAGHGALLFATTPIWIFLLAMIHLRERPSGRRALGIALALGGVLLIMSTGMETFGRDSILGDIIIWVAVLAWAYYSILGKPLAGKYGATRVTAYALASGAALYFPFGLYRAVQFDYAAVPPSAWLTVVYVGLGTSIVSYVLWYWLLKQMEASRVAVFHNVQPLIAIALAHIFLDEPLGATFLLGAAIVLVGVIITELNGQTAGPPRGRPAA